MNFLHYIKLNYIYRELYLRIIDNKYMLFKINDISS